MRIRSRGALRELVLVGAGHAHVQVLRRFMMRPQEGVRITLVVDRPEAVYSGMVPGFVAGDYSADELEIDAVPLARRARARVVLAPATRIDPHARRIETQGRPPLSYDVASLDVGSDVRGADLPGVLEHALATRPIRGLIDGLELRLAEVAPAGGRALQVVVVGGGAAGVELAFCLEARLRRAARDVEVSLVDAAAELLPAESPRLSRAARREAERRGIRLHCDARVAALEKDCVRLANGDLVGCDLAVWATGAAPPGLLVASDLPRDAAGFVRVEPSLQVEGHPDLFAAGDCASLGFAPWVSKAGVFAVREGPTLEHNLRARLDGRPLRAHRPQRDFLGLLNLGEGRALGGKWGLAIRGRAVFALKDWIDRRFMRRFQVLDGKGAPATDFPSPEAMGMEEMPCGGCAAKLGASRLERALERLGPPIEDRSVLLGLEGPDDAAALRMPGGDVLLATIDAFRAFSDDPYLVGRVAAVNALSDVWATGGTPRWALALVNVADEDGERGEETLFQVLAGMRAALDPLGVALVGGHTTAGEELFVGLSVHGPAPADGLLALRGAQPGDRLVLTKPLGTGVLLGADMQGLARGRWVQAVHTSMLHSNAAAAAVARAHGARGCTDVSGFGLAGHLASLLRAGGMSARLELAAIPALDGARALLARGVRSTYHEQNAAGRERIAFAPAAGGSEVELLFDPQTSGGLLFAVPADRASATLAALRAAGDSEAAEIGEATPPRDDAADFAVA